MSDPQILAWTSNSSASSRGGSIRWQAPELLDFISDTSPKNTTESDIYAWSCVCFEIFTGDLPFAHLQRESTIELHIMTGARPARPSLEDPAWRAWGLTALIWSLMEDCWQSNPKLRPKGPQVIGRLGCKDIHDEQASETSKAVSATRFRRRMNLAVEPNDVLPILNRILVRQKASPPSEFEPRWLNAELLVA
ncbi:hypothetical protein H0H92_000899 [Tricholoma furcatifolium]|nr:hypothetical protein H0H92_000899 [Tricholoma furcatifolium]